jgi:hypothetical protein
VHWTAPASEYEPIGQGVHPGPALPTAQPERIRLLRNKRECTRRPSLVRRQHECEQNARWLHACLDSGAMVDPTEAWSPMLTTPISDSARPTLDWEPRVMAAVATMVPKTLELAPSVAAPETA